MRFTLFFCCLIGGLYAQNQENIWYFGRNAGVSFNTFPPTALAGGQINTIEGSASIADSAGNLLFYTDGRTVYNRNHVQMNNGDEINSSSTRSSTQAALIVPRPNSPNLYYIFSAGEEGSALALSTVDMTQAAGLGRVISKQNILEDSTSERLTGVYHANGRDIWVLTHGYRNDSFKVYLVSPTGVAAPLRQQAGSVHSRAVLSEIGYMKTSHDGRKLALAVNFENYLEIFDFEPATGQISNPIRISSIGAYGPYGLEFSPNNRFLYVNELEESGRDRSRLIQYNLATSNIAASRFLIVQTSPRYGALQLANDQKIYYTRVVETNLGVISNPNALGPSVQVNNNEISLAPGRVAPGIGIFGLPNFMRGLVSTVRMSNICVNRPSRFELTGALSIKRAVWNFGDGSPPVNALTAQHTYSRKGLYTVTVAITYTTGRSKTLSQIIEIDSAASTLAALPDVCLTGSAVTLTQGSPSGGTYSGRGVNPATSTFNPAVAGRGTTPITYSYTTINGCTTPVTANISVRPPTALTITAGRDTVCLDSGDVNLDFISPPGGTYVGPGVVGNTFSPTRAGLGTHKITYILADICRSATSFNLTVVPPTRLSFSKSRPANNCAPVTLTFTNTSPSGSNFVWDPGDGAPLISARNLTHTYSKPGTYTVRLTAACARPVTDVVVVRGTNFRRQNDTTICAGENATLQVGGASRYTWRPAIGLSATDIPNPTAAPATTTTYTVEMTDTSDCTAFDTVKVTVLPKIIVDLKLATSDACDSIQKVSVTDNTAATPPLNFEYTWTKADGNQVKTSNLNTIRFDQAGLLQIRVKPQSRCVDDTTFSLKVGLSKNYLAFNATEISRAKGLACNVGEPVQLEASGGETYSWTPTTRLSDPKIANPIAAVNTSTTYTVKITNAAGCMVERSVFIRVPDQPTFDLKIEQTRENCNTAPKVTFINQTKGIANYAWDFGDGLRSTEPQPIHYYQEGGNYQIKLRVTTPDNCSRDTTFQLEIEKPITYNAFSPNGDNINEVFDIGLVGWGIEIYNRWGKLVYKKEAYQNDWNGNNLSAGTYYYTLTSPAGQTCRGWVSLLK